MVRALAGDFLRLPDVDVILLRDARLRDLPLPDCHVREIHKAAEERDAICELAARAARTVLIAPEFDDRLLQRCLWAEAAGARLLSPGSAFVQYAADKNLTAERLCSHGLPVPLAVRLEPGQRLPVEFPYPAVLKPADGAGSLGVRLISDAADPIGAIGQVARLEALCPGMPASVAILCGARGNLALPACRQRISRDGCFRYLGGQTPVDKLLASRAQTLALAAVASLPPAVGYVGVDLILGEPPGGEGDVVLEINPRLTTSYVGLRRLAETNLAGAMMAVADGDAIEVSYVDKQIRFEADGSVEVNEPSGV
jgi:predicted ATP-grasp superfamily ATP-dependent carboligase